MRASESSRTERFSASDCCSTGMLFTLAGGGPGGVQNTFSSMYTPRRMGDATVSDAYVVKNAARVKRPARSSPSSATHVAPPADSGYVTPYTAASAGVTYASVLVSNEARFASPSRNTRSTSASIDPHPP